jgi:hypothetical protein
MPHHDDQAKLGSWELQPHRFNNLPVHMALLHTGKVLAFGGSCNDDTRLTSPYDAELWDCETGECVILNQPLEGDVFCVGHSMLADGRLLAAGGTCQYDSKLFGLLPFPPFTGLNHAYLFDPVAERWERVQDMAYGRWYPTLVTLADGRVLCAAGLTESFPWVFLRAIEIYTPGQGWSHLEGADRWLPLYPRFHLLPDGNIFYSGSYNTHYTFPFTLTGFPTGILDMRTHRWSNLGLPNKSQREEGASVLLPLTPPDYVPKVLLAGGGEPGGTHATNLSEIIDLSQPIPRWRHTQSARSGQFTRMEFARYYNYAVVLPNRQVLIVGGRTGLKGHVHEPAPGHEHHGAAQADPTPDKNAVYPAEMFDPDTEEWATLAPMKIDRLYHSNALLLPDGRVLVAGSNPERRMNELRIEIYSPPYLFKGPRPVIESAPAEAAYSASVIIGTPVAEDIDEVALIRPSSTTHCLNTDQRYVGLAITERSANQITVHLPDDPNLAPPGYYMLFILRDGIPSVASWLRLHGDTQA